MLLQLCILMQISCYRVLLPNLLHKRRQHRSLYMDSQTIVTSQPIKICLDLVLHSNLETEYIWYFMYPNDQRFTHFFFLKLEILFTRKRNRPVYYYFFALWPECEFKTRLIELYVKKKIWELANLRLGELVPDLNNAKIIKLGELKAVTVYPDLFYSMYL